MSMGKKRNGERSGVSRPIVSTSRRIDSLSPGFAGERAGVRGKTVLRPVTCPLSRDA
jgi:hypothetical protein